jgi:hypothetical protein
MEAQLIYEFGVRYFSTYLKIHPETGVKYLRLGVLKPDAMTATGKPLFGVDAASVARHLTAISVYRVGLKAAARNVKELAYVS